MTILALPYGTEIGGNVAYSYYRGSTPVDAEKYQRSKRNAQTESRFRLNPTNRDVDSLIFSHRRGILARWLTELGHDLVVVDIGGRIQPYRVLIEQNTRLYVGLDLQFEGLVDLIASAEVLPLATDSIDLVLCTDTLQYVPDAGAAVREMHRALKPDGQLILSTRGAYPEHHDELWRFLPGGLRYLCRMFKSVEVASEGRSGSGMMITLNVLLHRNIRSALFRRFALRVTIPLLNKLGPLFDRMAPEDTRSTCGISVRAIK